MTQNVIKIVFFVTVAFVAIGFASKKRNALQVGDISVDLTSEDGNYFVEAEEIFDLLSQSSYGNINNIKASKLNLKSLERKIASHSHVREAEVFQDLGGNLTIKVTEHQPIARIFNRDGKDIYISSTGKVIPESVNYTPRVMMIEFEKFPQLTSSIKELSMGNELFSFLKHIRNHEFWKSQVAYIYVNQANEVELYPQVTKQVVEFGTLNNFEKKMKKLMFFYKRVLPRKGWNTYERVSLKYENQIVCE